MRTNFIAVATTFAAVSHVSAQPLVEYQRAIFEQPGFAQSEFDRILKDEPVGMGYALVTEASRVCELPKQSFDLAKHVKLMEAGRHRELRPIVASAVVDLGYPTVGDRAGVCRKAIEILGTLEKAGAWCRTSIQKAHGFMTTCF